MSASPISQTSSLAEKPAQGFPWPEHLEKEPAKGARVTGGGPYLIKHEPHRGRLVVRRERRDVFIGLIIVAIFFPMTSIALANFLPGADAFNSGPLIGFLVLFAIASVAAWIALWWCARHFKPRPYVIIHGNKIYLPNVARTIIRLDDVYAFAFLTIHRPPRIFQFVPYGDAYRSELALLAYPRGDRDKSKIRKVTIAVTSTYTSGPNSYFEFARTLAKDLAAAGQIPTFRIFNGEVRIWDHIWDGGSPWVRY